MLFSSSTKTFRSVLVQKNIGHTTDEANILLCKKPEFKI